MRSPNAKNYLKCSQKNNSEYRNKSPKDFKIDQIPEDTDVYQEINIIKGKAKNSNNLVVSKIFRKKKNAVKYILNRRKESKNWFKKEVIFKTSDTKPIELESKTKKKLANRLAVLCEDFK